MFEKIAYAAPAAAQSEVNPIVNFLPFLLLIAIFYFLLIRPQQKRQKETQKMIENLKKGDSVVTTGGLLGVILNIKNDSIVLKIGNSDQTKVEVLKSAVAGLRGKDEEKK